MNIPRLRKLKPALTKFLKRFDHGFPRKDTHAHLPVYVSGQLSDLPEKSVAPIARNAGVPPRTLQEFLSQHHGDHDLWRDDLPGVVRDDHSGPHSVGISDATSDVKQGDKTPGVQRPGRGSVGQTENGIVTVHLASARDGFPCLLDGELDRPKSWSDDRGRCRAAGIPDDLACRPPWKIALGLDDHAVAHGPRCDWLTFDAGYGGTPERPRERSGRGQKCVAEVPRHFTGGVKAPRVVTRPFHKHGRGRGRKTPRLASGSPPPRRVDAMLDRDGFRNQPWVKWRVQDGPKGPMVWEVQHPRFFPVGADGLPGEPPRLIIAREARNPAEWKFLVSNAPAETPVDTLRLVAFARWRVARGFEDQKRAIGLDQYEGRRDQGWKRHPIPRGVSSLFPSRTRQEFGGEKSGADGVPGARRDRGTDPVLVVEPLPAEGSAGADLREDRASPAPQRHGAEGPRQTDTAAIARVGHQAHRTAPMQVGDNLETIREPLVSPVRNKG